MSVQARPSSSGQSSEISDSYDLELPEGVKRTPVKPARLTYQPPKRTLKDVAKGLIAEKTAFKNRYKYKKLSSDDEIRILILHEGKSHEKIECSLVRRRMSDPKCRYAALSYYWGEDDATNEIRIRTEKVLGPSDGFYEAAVAMGGPQPFYVRSNLYAALGQLRREDTPLPLWVDALCIDQNNKEEKNHQVSKMAAIYNHAIRVCVWLGEGSHETDSAIAFVPEILDLSNFDNFIKDASTPPKWFALAELMRNRWFTRRWVVQELALAREANLYCGNRIVHWDDFADAVALFVTKFDSVKRLFQSSKEFGFNPDKLGDVRALGANILVEATTNLFRKSDNGKIQECLSTLETLVSRLLTFEASDTRDTIYALLSIAKDTPAGFDMSQSQDLGRPNDASFILNPDYKKSELEVYKTYTDFCIQSSGSLDIICRHWAPMRTSRSTNPMRQLFLQNQRRDKLPSWVPLLAESPFGNPEDALNGRVSGDSLVGRPDRKCYNASKGTTAKEARFGELAEVLAWNTNQEAQQSDEEVWNDAAETWPETISDGTLYVQGFHVDTISELSSRIAEGIILTESLKMGGWDESDGQVLERVPEKLWRTLVADRGPDGTNPPSWYHRACLYCLSHRTNNGDLNTRILIAEAKASMMVEFLKRVQSVVWNRKFFLSKEKGRFGLAPKRTREGDMICILYGCSVPVILREHSTDRDVFYELIGEAYVHGLMDGEAMELGTPATEFKLGARIDD
jgi:hypothetical protein